MNWSLIGWIFIGVSAILLALFTFLFRSGKGYPIRKTEAVEAYKGSQVASIEEGRARQVLLGESFWTYVYPGLGLQALTIVPKLLDLETAVDGGMSLSGGDGSLAVFARQIVDGRYQDGFSTKLSPIGVRTTLPGVTPLSLTAGLLSELSLRPYGSLALLGHYGPAALLLAETVIDKGGRVLGTAGTLAAQAALFPSIQNLLIGEMTYMLPGLFKKSTGHQAAWLTEDILRVLLILGLIVGAILKMIGVL